jgi:hypothetical protein
VIGRYFWLVLLASACASSGTPPSSGRAAEDWQRFDYAPGISALFPETPRRVGDDEEPPAVATDRIDDAAYFMMCFDTTGLTPPKIRALFDEERASKINGRPLLSDKTVDRDGGRESRFALRATLSSGVVLVQHDLLILKGQTLCAFTVAVVDGTDRSQEVARFFGGIRIDVDSSQR